MPGSTPHTFCLWKHMHLAQSNETPKQHAWFLNTLILSYFYQKVKGKSTGVYPCIQSRSYSEQFPRNSKGSPKHSLSGYAQHLYGGTPKHTTKVQQGLTPHISRDGSATASPLAVAPNHRLGLCLGVPPPHTFYLWKHMHFAQSNETPKQHAWFLNTLILSIFYQKVNGKSTSYEGYTPAYNPEATLSNFHEIAN